MKGLPFLNKWEIEIEPVFPLFKKNLNSQILDLRFQNMFIPNEGCDGCSMSRAIKFCRILRADFFLYLLFFGGFSVVESLEFVGLWFLFSPFFIECPRFDT